MKILYVTALFAPDKPGGAEITLRTLVSGMQERGHEVAVLATSPDVGLRIENVEGIRVYRAGIRNLYWHLTGTSKRRRVHQAWHLLESYNPLLRSYIRNVIERENPIVVSCSNLAGWPALPGTKLMPRENPLFKFCMIST